MPGHEGVGIVQRVGRRVTRVAEGDRVAIPWLGWACGECKYCTTGWETLYERQKNSGYSVDRAWAEYALAYGAYVGKVPDGIDPFEAGPLTCAGLTTYKAVKVSGARPSDLVAIFGVGAWATWRCSTPRPPALRWWPSTWSTRSCRWPKTWGPPTR